MRIELTISFILIWGFHFDLSVKTEKVVKYKLKVGSLITKYRGKILDHPKQLEARLI